MNNQKNPSNRTFGFMFVLVFSMLGLWKLWKGGGWLLIELAIFTALITIFQPNWLSPLNRAWMKLGQLMHKIVNPLVMAVIFFGVVTPAGILMRTLRGDPLLRKFSPQAETYWIMRQPPGPTSESLKQQF